MIDRRRSHWVAKAPAGRTVEWDAEIINEIPNELIGWRTLEDADVVSAGSVRFQPRGQRPRHRSARAAPVRRRRPAKSAPPIAWLFGHEPSQTIREDLRRFKQLLETGEVANHRRTAARSV